MYLPRRLVRNALPALTGLAVLAAVGVGCGAMNEPPRSPLAEPTASASPAPGATPPLPTAAPASRGEGAPPASQVEPAAARATALLAEWLGVPQRELTVAAAEAVVWPDACLGVALPGTACATVLTPGFRVLLRDALGGLHAVHLAAGSGGAARWAGEVRAQGSLVSFDRGIQRLTLTVDGQPLVLRVAPGTSWVTGAFAAAPGTRLIVGYDPGGAASALPVAAWVAPAP